MRLEVSLPSFKLGPFPTLKLPPSALMGEGVWSWWEGSRVASVTHSLGFLGWPCHFSWSQFAPLYPTDSFKPYFFHLVE